MLIALWMVGLRSGRALVFHWSFGRSASIVFLARVKPQSPFPIVPPSHCDDCGNDLGGFGTKWPRIVEGRSLQTHVDSQRKFASGCLPDGLCRSFTSFPQPKEHEGDNEQQSGSKGPVATRHALKLPPLENQRLLQVGLLGVPNSGKSQLTNKLIGTKVTAVSSKANTTVLPHLGAFVDGDTQVVLHDLPGVVRTKDVRYRGQSERVETAWATASQCDRALFIVDAARQLKRKDEAVLELARSLKEGVATGNDKVLCYPETILVLNKSDLVPKADRTNLTQLGIEMSREFQFQEYFIISALYGMGIQKLKDYMVSQASPKWWVLPPGAASDQSPMLLALELVREKLYRRLNRELPYNLELVHDTLKRMRNGSIFIGHTLFVDNKNVKNIVVGKKGEIIQDYIVARAQSELEKILGTSVMLVIKVKIRTK